MALCLALWLCAHAYMALLCWLQVSSIRATTSSEADQGQKQATVVTTSSNSTNPQQQQQQQQQAADVVVIAAGVGSVALAAELGYQLPLLSKPAAIVMTQPLQQTQLIRHMIITHTGVFILQVGCW